MAVPERFTCPRRGPWLPALKADPDHWKKDRWKDSAGRAWESFWTRGRGFRWLVKLHDWGLLRQFPVLGGITWLWPWTPRTCSYCGGIHPEDASRLVDEGWEVEFTDKRYKAYLQPPGKGWGPVPPVKVYGGHVPNGWPKVRA